MQPRAPTRDRFRAARLAAMAVFVSIGCYLGSMSVGRLRFGGDGPAILFPPYAVLVAALLVAPARTWWMFLLAASVGSFIPHRGISPISHVLMAEFANYIKAIVAAGGLRWIWGSARDLKTLRRMALFVAFVGVVGPVVGATIGAVSATTFGRATNYWLVWRGWTLSNALTGITLLPPILLGITCLACRPRWASPARMAEVFLMFAGLLGVGVVVFLLPADESRMHASRLCWPLPLLLWAAVRFGIGGTSLSLLTVTLLAIRGAIGGRGPFIGELPAENVFELQLFLIATSLPLLLLASLVGEQRQTAIALGKSEHEVRQRLADQEHAESVLRQSERLKVAILASLREHVAVLDRQGAIITVNEAWMDFARSGLGTETDSDAPYAGVNYLDVCRREDDADAAKALKGIREVLNGSIPWFEMEYECRTSTEDRWFLMAATPLEDAEGGGAVVSHRDVTDLKNAEHAIQRSEVSLRASNQRAQVLAGRLLTAQEAERSRIARELHDDVDQQLAAISLSISALRRSMPADENPRVQDELAAIQRLAIDAAEDVRVMSHQLHPGVLRHAGLPAALKSYCAEFRARHGIHVTFDAEESVESLMASAGTDAALCLYRAAQEALGNVARHAGARHAHVSLTRTDVNGTGIELLIKDDGRGFDVAAAREAGGLGLLSIDERARLVRGSATIESQPRSGTIVRLTIPIGGTPDALPDSINCG